VEHEADSDLVASTCWQCAKASRSKLFSVPCAWPVAVPPRDIHLPANLEWMITAREPPSARQSSLLDQPQRYTWSCTEIVYDDALVYAPVRREAGRQKI
jgi:hypothetical protein